MFLVYGLQKSGIAITKLLQKKNLNFKIWDDNLSVRKKLKKKFDKNIFFNPKYQNLNNFKEIFVSPGISIRQKKFEIKNKSLKIKRDLNLYVSNLEKQKVIAITGTNGKSTTTKLIGDILKKNKLKAFVGGNIGKPLCNAFLSRNSYKFHVIELSSFQLEKVKKLNTNISIITNLATDHLDRYNNFNDYINQKKNIISKKGFNLISIDDEYSRNLFKQKNIKNKISFSIINSNADVYMGNNYILDNYFKKNKKLFLKNISKYLNENFNNQNILIAYICTKLLNLSENNFKSIVKNFKGLPYRSTVIYNSNKYKIVNNSKSTNLSSTINSIENYNNIYLILGGIAKEKNFEIILNYKKKIKNLYVFGKSASMIEKKLKKELKVKKYKNLKLLINQVINDIKKSNDYSTVLFAPACTSFDQYKNFEERGKDFTKLFKMNLKKL